MARGVIHETNNESIDDYQFQTDANCKKFIEVFGRDHFKNIQSNSWQDRDSTINSISVSL